MEHETIIIGGGMAGLACARRLQEEGREFLLLTENVGGRVLCENGINYGAYYITEDYTNIRQFAVLGAQIRPTDIRVHDGTKQYSIISPNIVLLLPEYIRLVHLLRAFRKRLQALRKRCIDVPQDVAIQEDSELYALYTTTAKDFVQRNRIDGITRKYLDPFFRCIGFVTHDEPNASAFLFLQGSLPIISATYEFHIDMELFTKYIAKQIRIETAMIVEKQKGGYKITTKKGSYKTKRLVIATPPEITARLLKRQQPRGVNAITLNIRGTCRLRGKYHVFHRGPFGIARQKDGSYLFCSDGKTAPEEYFTNMTIAGRHEWSPAFRFTRTLESSKEDDCYIIGDHIILSVEDAYISGIWAANDIIRR